MEVVGIGNGDGLLKELPKAPSFLSPSAKRNYKELGEILISAQLLKEIHLKTLEIFATNYEQWKWSVKAIADKNKEKLGSGYMQVFSTGATNLTTELTIKRNAEKAMAENIASFGMDPQNEKKLNMNKGGEQGDLFEGFKNFAKSQIS